MNIRDYLLLGIDSSEEKMITAKHDDEAIYYDGRRESFYDVLEFLHSFDHEVTLSEIKEVCESRDGDCLEDVNDGRPFACPFCVKRKVDYYGEEGECLLMTLQPCRWPIEKIENKLKETV